MTISDLRPGDLVTFRGEPYILEAHLGDGVNSILQWADDPKYTACVPSALEVVDGKIDDRRYGSGEEETPGAIATSGRETYGGDPPLRRGIHGLPTPPMVRSGSSSEPTPGVFDNRGPLLRWLLLGLASWALFGAAAMLPPGRFPEAGMYGLIAVMLIAVVWRD